MRRKIKYKIKYLSRANSYLEIVYSNRTNLVFLALPQ